LEISADFPRFPFLVDSRRKIFRLDCSLWPGPETTSPPFKQRERFSYTPIGTRDIPEFVRNMAQLAELRRVAKQTENTKTQFPRNGQEDIRGGDSTMHDIWKDMFVMGLPLLEKILRPIIVYVFLVVSLRLSGKRELVQLNPFDLVVLLTLSNTVQNAIIGEDNSVIGGLIGAASLLVTNYLVVRFLYDHRKIDQLVEGKSDVLVENGKVQTQHLKKELITLPQLEAAARKQGFESLSEVAQCVLEPGGTLTFLGKKPDTEDVRHQELLERLEKLRQEIGLLRGSQPPARA
jgi:uncharacterized membrane protein YcaP (DUF421 family)